MLGKMKMPEWLSTSLSVISKVMADRTEKRKDKNRNSMRHFNSAEEQL